MEKESVKKIAIIFPGMGYHKDKPLLYYSGRIARAFGFELFDIEYHDMPQKIQGDKKLILEAGMRAYTCATEQLSEVDLPCYDEILLIGKSIGTVVAAKYNLDHRLGANQLWYTPVEATFDYADGNIEAFIGDNVPNSEYSDDYTILDVMEKTRQFIGAEGK